MHVSGITRLWFFSRQCIIKVQQQKKNVKAKFIKEVFCIISFSVKSEGSYLPNYCHIKLAWTLESFLVRTWKMWLKLRWFFERQ